MPFAAGKFNLDTPARRRFALAISAPALFHQFLTAPRANPAMAHPENFPTDSKLPSAEIQRATRHVFLCVGPDCCDPAEHEPLWNLLKSETRRLSVPVLRTKAACLRICTEGPWMVVYPDGIWYGQLDSSRLLRILKEHLEEGRPVREWIAAEMPCLALSPERFHSSPTAEEAP